MTITVSVEAKAAVMADEAYRRLIDFDRYPELTSTVRSVDVAPGDADDVLLSSWAVDFRGGILHWTERDSLDRRARVLSFEQVVGDLDVFAGRWHVLPDGEGCRVLFDAELDMGIPSLAAIIDPIARNALRDNVLLILSGLLGPLRSASGDPLQPARPRPVGAGPTGRG